MMLRLSFVAVCLAAATASLHCTSAVSAEQIIQSEENGTECPATAPSIDSFSYTFTPTVGAPISDTVAIIPGVTTYALPQFVGRYPEGSKFDFSFGAVRLANFITLTSVPSTKLPYPLKYEAPAFEFALPAADGSGYASPFNFGFAAVNPNATAECPQKRTQYLVDLTPQLDLFVEDSSSSTAAAEVAPSSTLEIATLVPFFESSSSTGAATVDESSSSSSDSAIEIATLAPFEESSSSSSTGDAAPAEQSSTLEIATLVPFFESSSSTGDAAPAEQSSTLEIATLVPFYESSSSSGDAAPVEQSSTFEIATLLPFYESSSTAPEAQPIASSSSSAIDAVLISTSTGTVTPPIVVDPPEIINNSTETPVSADAFCTRYAQLLFRSSSSCAEQSFIAAILTGTKRRSKSTVQLPLQLVNGTHSESALAVLGSILGCSAPSFPRVESGATFTFADIVVAFDLKKLTSFESALRDTLRFLGVSIADYETVLLKLLGSARDTLPQAQLASTTSSATSATAASAAVVALASAAAMLIL